MEMMDVGWLEGEVAGQKRRRGWGKCGGCRARQGKGAAWRGTCRGLFRSASLEPQCSRAQSLPVERRLSQTLARPTGADLGNCLFWQSSLLGSQRPQRPIYTWPANRNLVQPLQTCISRPMVLDSYSNASFVSAVQCSAARRLPPLSEPLRRACLLASSCTYKRSRGRAESAQHNIVSLVKQSILPLLRALGYLLRLCRMLARPCGEAMAASPMLCFVPSSLSRTGTVPFDRLRRLGL